MSTSHHLRVPSHCVLTGSFKSRVLFLIHFGLPEVFRVIEHDVVEHISLTVHLLITRQASANLGETDVSLLATGKPLGGQLCPVVVDRVATILVPRIETALEGAPSTLVHGDADAVQRHQAIRLLGNDPLVVVIRALNWRHQSLHEVTFSRFADIDVCHVLILR